MTPVPVKELRPTECFRLYGHVFQVERQARRSTFARAIKGPLAGYARIQLKHSKTVNREAAA